MSAHPPAAFYLTSQDWEMMRQEVDRLAPQEACGLISGLNERALQVIPITNALHSPVRFRMDPVEQIQALQHIEGAGRELIGIYHSHPQGPPHPSPTDIHEAAFLEAAYLIWFPRGSAWFCRAFLIEKPGYREIRLMKDGKLVHNE